jgi:Amidohydrolase family
MQAMILTAPPQAGQVSMSMPNTRFKRCAQVIDARRSASVFACPSSMTLGLLPFPRLASVTTARCLPFGVNRVTNDSNVRAPEQRVSRLGALKAVTLDAAYSLQLGKDVGSIVPGKLANITILPENPVTSEPMKIKDIAVWGTVQEGRVHPVKVASMAPTTTLGYQTNDVDFAQVTTQHLVGLLSYTHDY